MRSDQIVQRWIRTRMETRGRQGLALANHQRFFRPSNNTTRYCCNSTSSELLATYQDTGNVVLVVSTRGSSVAGPERIPAQDTTDSCIHAMSKAFEAGQSGDATVEKSRRASECGSVRNAPMDREECRNLTSPCYIILENDGEQCGQAWLQVPRPNGWVCIWTRGCQPVVGHMEMTWPYALHSKFNPDNDYNDIDYSNTSPLNADGSNFPCKGYQNDRPFNAVAEFVAGTDHNLTLAGSATHNGGSCQISLSYDNGATFRVIKSIIGGCPLVSSYDFTIPSTAPSGDALLAWTWQNLSGNREFYMNCAQVNVVTAPTKRRRRQAFDTFESLPLIWKGNLRGINDCATTEGDDVVYPNPGPSVSYGNGLSDSSPPTEGTCDSAQPYGQTYQDLGDTPSSDSQTGETPSPSGNTTAPIPDTSNATTTVATASYTASFITIATLIPARSSDVSLKSTFSRTSATFSTLVPRSLAMEQIKLAAMTTHSASISTVTVTADCESTVTITINSPSQAPATTTADQAPVASPHPPYATGDPNGVDGYLPCVAGTFLCTSKTTWQTCNYNDGSVKSSLTWVWGSERTVAAGMECLPFLSPHTDQTSSQQGGSPKGSYRDDRYVRARPEGDCATNGSLQCTYGGQQFSICDQGGWIPMGSVASGTTCQDGKIVAA